MKIFSKETSGCHLGCLWLDCCKKINLKSKPYKSFMQYRIQILGIRLMKTIQMFQKLKLYGSVTLLTFVPFSIYFSKKFEFQETVEFIKELTNALIKHTYLLFSLSLVIYINLAVEYQKN
jgi:hypothetical protein